MTDKEKAIVMAHTGICMLTGDKFQIFHKYVEDIMGRPIMTHEMGLLSNMIKEKARPDFMALCADESGSDKTAYCKDCKYFEYDNIANVDVIPIIAAHEICKRWGNGNGCRTSENGYCFLFEPKEDDRHEK